MRSKVHLAKLAELVAPAIIGAVILLLVPTQVGNSVSLLNQSGSSHLFPNLIGYCLIGLSLLQTVHYLRNPEDGGEPDEEPKQPRLNKPLVYGIASLLAYVLLMPVLGFLLASFLGILAFVYVLGSTQWYKAVLFSLVCTIIVWTGFDLLLQIPLPKGILGI